ncbi:ATP-binding cassette domain-containing protein [Gottschalkia acidurici]|uniref:ATP-binding cassette domain-containing protein n=1 Tax=Clostridium acidurici TaxID=1556 RepID=UPI00030752BA|nr:ABC transporter ATP-binding protein [Gottschalkia acidurici]
MIKIRNVHKSFENFKALDDISIDIKKGTIHGLIGENGAGKTTLIQSLVGIYTVDEGEILIDGKTIYDNNDVKKDIGYVADRNQFFTGYRIKELIEFFSYIYPTFSKESFDNYNKKLNLDVNKKVKQLSKGMQMRLSLMLNLAIHPKVLVLDEPTSGLDAIVKKIY